jgi:hypothetical protein
MDFDDNLDLIPPNIIGLTITNDKKSTLYKIPQHIKHIHLYSNETFIIIPSTVETVTVLSSYVDKFPYFFDCLPYGIKTIKLEIYAYVKNVIEYDLNTLPDSIETILINIIVERDNSNDITIKLNKIYPNLTYINYYFTELCYKSNYDEIKQYAITNNIMMK